VSYFTGAWCRHHAPKWYSRAMIETCRPAFGARPKFGRPPGPMHPGGCSDARQSDLGKLLFSGQKGDPANRVAQAVDAGTQQAAESGARRVYKRRQRPELAHQFPVVGTVVDDAYGQKQREGDRCDARGKQTPRNKVGFGRLPLKAMGSAGAAAECERERADQ